MEFVLKVSCDIYGSSCCFYSSINELCTSRKQLSLLDYKIPTYIELDCPNTLDNDCVRRSGYCHRFEIHVYLFVPGLSGSRLE